MTEDVSVLLNDVLHFPLHLGRLSRQGTHKQIPHLQVTRTPCLQCAPRWLDKHGIGSFQVLPSITSHGRSATSSPDGVERMQEEKKMKHSAVSHVEEEEEEEEEEEKEEEEETELF